MWDTNDESSIPNSKLNCIENIDRHRKGSYEEYSFLKPNICELLLPIMTQITIAHNRMKHVMYSANIGVRIKNDYPIVTLPPLS